MTITTVSPRNLADLCKSGKIDLIDVRTPVEFREVHAAEARNLPLDRLDPQSVMHARDTNHADPLYVICRSGGSAAVNSHRRFHSTALNGCDACKGGISPGNRADGAPGRCILRGFCHKMRKLGCLGHGI